MNVWILGNVSIIFTKDWIWAVQWPSIIWSYLSSAKVNKIQNFCNLCLIHVTGNMAQMVDQFCQTYIKYRKVRRDFYPYENMEIKNPLPYLVDLTAQFLNAGNAKLSLHIASLLHYFDNCCFANVKCPWGCHEFLGDCGMVSYEKCIIPFCR